MYYNLHTIKLTASDNNSNSSILSFSILENGIFQIHNLINYPNPVSGLTNISFQINEPAKDLKVAIDIFTIDGRAVARMKKDLNTTGTFIDIPLDMELQKLSPGL
jgi:hypothetical protein